MCIMALDYGDARTGVAISDPTGLLAGKTATIHARRMEAAAQQAAEIARAHGVTQIVLGHPVNMDGSLGPRSQAVHVFKALLEEAAGLPVTLWDERRTTLDAHQILFRNGKNGRQRKHLVDAVAAALILEGYLTYRRIHEGEA